MRKTAPALLALALALLAGCGGGDKKDKGDPIPASKGDALVTQLEGIQSAFDNGRCGSAKFQISNQGQLQDKAEELPDAVGVKQALLDGIGRLSQLVDQQCEAPTDTQKTQTETIPTETETTPTHTEPTQTQHTDTEPTDTQNTDTQPTQTNGGVTIPNGGALPPGQQKKLQKDQGGE